jgi:hypothetical protein
METWTQDLRGRSRKTTSTGNDSMIADLGIDETIELFDLFTIHDRGSSA